MPAARPNRTTISTAGTTNGRSCSRGQLPVMANAATSTTDWKKKLTIATPVVDNGSSSRRSATFFTRGAFHRIDVVPSVTASENSPKIISPQNMKKPKSGI